MSPPTFKCIGHPSVRVIEECSELIQALCKAERFGWFNHHPAHSERTNLEDVKAEMDDVIEAIAQLRELMRQFP